MPEITEHIQQMFREISESEGIPVIDISSNDGGIVSFGDGLMLYVQLRPQIPELDFIVPLQDVPQDLKAVVYEALLAANFLWNDTLGATLAYSFILDTIVIQYHELVENITKERLQQILEKFLDIATDWNNRLQKLIDKAAEKHHQEQENKELGTNQQTNAYAAFNSVKTNSTFTIGDILGNNGTIPNHL